MKLTTESLARFVGGQIEIQNEGEGYLYRGEVKEIAADDSQLIVQLAWMAKSDGYPDSHKKWVRDDCSDYTASLEIYEASDIGPGTKGSGRIMLVSRANHEIVVLLPSDSSHFLDPKHVEGLRLAQVWTKEDILKMWPQAAGELRGFQRALEAKSAITAGQIGMAVQLAETEFQRLKGEDVDWTVDPSTDGSISSPEFLRLCEAVEKIIKGSAFDLSQGNTTIVAVLIMAKLAHEHGLAPKKR